MTPSRIGFIATHFNGTDRVSLESACWSRVLTDMGHECFFFTGESDEPEERTVIVPEADSHHPDVELINHELYDADMRSSKTSGMIQALRFHIKQHLHQFIHTFDINILIVENALSLPVNIPLGLALTELIAETGIPT
ncbi:MAG: glycosyltransferase family 1 protein, partial [Anaerolineales bacterium]